MGLVNPRILADVVNIDQFPELTQLYQVMTVPKTIVDDRLVVIGAAPEEVFLKAVLGEMAKNDTVGSSSVA